MSYTAAHLNGGGAGGGGGGGRICLDSVYWLQSVREIRKRESNRWINLYKKKKKKNVVD